jgi:hypothetical protein
MDDLTMTDDLTTELLHMIVALEETVHARFPRSILVRARLRRELRASVAQIGEGGDFPARRTGTVASGWLMRPGTPLGATGAAARWRISPPR